jgi:hypothetical protein
LEAKYRSSFYPVRLGAIASRKDWTSVLVAATIEIADVAFGSAQEIEEIRGRGGQRVDSWPNRLRSKLPQERRGEGPVDPLAVLRLFEEDTERYVEQTSDTAKVTQAWFVVALRPVRHRLFGHS